MEYINGDRYEGQWREGMRWGFGKLRFQKDGESYEGEWFKDLMHGNGIFMDRKGMQEGSWDKGICIMKTIVRDAKP